MLQTIREFALELLQGTAPSEEEETYGHRAEYFVALAEQGWAGLQGHQQELWMERLEVEHANLVSVMKWAVEQQDGEISMRLGAALWMFWGLREYNSEGVKWLRQALGMPWTQVPNDARAMALFDAAAASMNLGDVATTRAYMEESVAIFRQLRPEERGGREFGILLVTYGLTLVYTGELEAGRTAADEGLSLLRQAGNRWGLSMATLVWAAVSNALGDHVAARAAFEESIALSREMGNIWVLAQALNGLGDNLRIEGDYTRAKEAYEESLDLLRRLNSRGDIPALLHNLGHVALAQGDVEEAKRHFVEALHLHFRQKNRVGIAECLAGLGGVAGAEKRPEQAARLFGAAQALREAGGALVALYPAEQMDYERNVAIARAQLAGEPGKEGSWERAWEGGRAMSMEQAIEYAL